MTEQNKKKPQKSEHELNAEQLAALLEAKIERARLMQQSFRQVQLAKQLA
jgi:hypothetical protein